MEHERPLQSIPDDDLLRRLAELTQQSRRVEVDLVALIGEVDERKLYAREASPSMFVYCTQVLHLSEAEAYLRITVARASREHPMLLTLLGDGRLHLTGIARLVPYLTRDNRDTLLKRATHKSRRQIEELIAEVGPRPDALALMRKLPERKGTIEPPVPSTTPERAEMPVGLCLDRVGMAPSTLVAPTVPARVPPAVVQPLSPARYKVQFTASAQLHDKLERLRALLRRQVPDGDLATVIELAVTEKLEGLEARRFAQTSTPRKTLSESDTSPSSRHIPAPVRRAVHERDQGRCRYVDGKGRRCPERGRLEYHHRHPFALGGDRSLQNICLMCHAHNQYLGEQDYGRKAMARHRGSGSRVSDAAPSAAARSPAIASAIRSTRCT